jgi:hypothetical protein
VPSAASAWRRRVRARLTLVRTPVVAENPSEQKSCGLADVAMVKATDFG